MKALSILMSVFLIIGLTAGVAMAKAKSMPKLEKMSGVVEKVDTVTGDITVKVRGKDLNLKGDPKMLEGITVGEKVIIEKAGNELKMIKAVPAHPAKK